METKDNETVGLLNDLIRINNDRIEGYERATEDTDDPQLKTMFQSMAQESRKFKNELLTEVIKLEGKPEEGTTTSGKVFRTWMDFKSAVAGKDRKAILSSCEFGEDSAKETYQKVMESDKLVEPYRSIVTSQYATLKQSHDKVKAMRENSKTL
jgi:uncharacterized protein (TIGR02284 family)